MATYEHNGLLTYKDSTGNKHLLYPVTKKDCVDGMEAIDAHLVSAANPHGVTAAQAGAAPAGFGLGQSCISVDSWDNAVKNGWYTSENGGPTAEIYYGYVINYTDEYMVQNAYIITEDNCVRWASRTRLSGIFGQWEWLNPPMQIGVEYRTTERFGAKPVYTKLIDCGLCANDKTITIEHNSIIRYTGMMSNIPLPYVSASGFDGEYAAWAEVNDGFIKLWINGFDAYQTYVQLWYVKN